MQKNLKRVLACVLVVVMTLTAAPLSGFVGLELPEWNVAEWFSSKASALDATGKCGENVTYTYDSSTGEVVISGTGSMYNYDYDTSPFKGSSIKKVVIKNNVTSIGEYAFYDCTSLQKVILPHGLTFINGYVFYNCIKLENIELPDTLMNIGKYAFYNCDSLTNVFLPESTIWMGPHAFDDCSSLLSFTISNMTYIDSCILANCTKLQSVMIPANMINVCGDGFYNSYPDDIYYAGTQEQWNKMNVGYGPAWYSAKIHYNYVPEQKPYSLTGTLDSYDWTVELDGDDSWISRITVDGKSYSVKKNLITSGLDEHINKTVILKVENREVVYFKPLSTVRTNVSCTGATQGEKLTYSKKKFSSNQITLSLDIYNNLKEVSTCLDEISKTPDYDLNVSEVTLKTSNIDILNFSGKAEQAVKLNKIVSIGKNAHETVTVDVNKSYKIPSDKKQEEITVTCIISGTKDGSQFTKTTETKITVLNKDYKEPGNTSSQVSADAKKAAEALSGITGAAAIENTSLRKLFTGEQLDAIEDLILCEVVMSKTPQEKLDIGTEVFEKVFKFNSKTLGCKEDEIRITVANDTEYGEVEVAFICKFLRHSEMGGEYGFNGTICYEFVGGKGAKKLPSDIEKSGLAGGLSAANVSAFCEAAYSVVESYIKSAYNTFWGDDANKVADIVFGKSVNEILSHTKYKSVSGLAWVLMTTPAKKVKVECPVDVYVYNANDELVAAVENNEVVKTDEHAKITVNGDVKEILLFDESYYVVYEATAEGTMRITVDEYANSEDKLRSVVTENIPLSVDTVYHQDIDSEYLDDSDYSLTSNEETIWSPTLDESAFHSHVSDGEWFDGEKATCTTDGYQYCMCSVCGDWFIEITEPATGHTEASDPAAAPTCTETGHTEGRHCSVCGEVLVPQEIIPATGHTDKDSDGKCDTCGETLEAVRNCTHLCHKTGFMGFIWKIVNLFNKLFRINPVCECGMKHY